MIVFRFVYVILGMVNSRVKEKGWLYGRKCSKDEAYAVAFDEYYELLI